MANEAQINSSLQVRFPGGNSKGIDYRPGSTSFKADVGGPAGPTPGNIVATTAGTIVDLTALTIRGGFCRMQNLDPNNFVEWGVYNLGTNEFYPAGELLPGEFYVVRLSRFLGREMPPTAGTGSVGAGVSLMLKADASSCRVLVEAFDK